MSNRLVEQEKCSERRSRSFGESGCQAWPATERHGAGVRHRGCAIKSKRGPYEDANEASRVIPFEFKRFLGVSILLAKPGAVRDLGRGW